MSRFDRIDNTAPIVDVAENRKPQVQYSNFDENRKIVGQALPYAIIPIDVIETLPNTEAWLNYDVQITFRNPSVRKMLNGWRCYLHAYYNRKSDLWEGWNNFITRGRSGTESGGGQGLEIPHIKTRIKNSKPGVGSFDVSPFTPMSLYNYLGYPSEVTPMSGGVRDLTKTCGVKPQSISNDSKTGLANYTNIKISALKAVMYQRLWRDKFAPQNLLQNNKNLFPDNEDHFILSYNANEVSRIKYENENGESYVSAEQKQWYTLNDTNCDVRIDCLRFRQFAGDRFTTSSPFPEMLRGNAPELDINISADNLKAVIPENTQLVDEIGFTWSDDERSYLTTGTLNGTDATKQSIATHSPSSSGNTNFYATNDYSGEYIIPQWDGGASEGATAIGQKLTGIKKTQLQLAIAGNVISSSISLSQLRSLEVFTIFAERMARTNGNYNELIKAQYGHNPKALNREAIYIGGSYQDILSNSIFQTSNNSEDQTPLGTQVSMGQSASYNKLGYFKADDYGYIMVVMSIVPETIYTTGINKLDTSLTMEEQYFPIMNNLSAEAVLNKEIYVSGNEEVDNDVWGYAERFSEYKSRRSKAVGLSELPSEISAYDSALIMARRFNQSQDLNADFVTGYPTNYSLDSFTSNEEAPFDFAIREDVNINYPMPYVTIPEGLGTRA